MWKGGVTEEEGRGEFTTVCPPHHGERLTPMIGLMTFGKER